MSKLSGFLSGIAGFVRKKTRLCVSVVIGLALVVGGTLTFLEWQARKQRTLEFAAGQINQALATKDMALLARYVDLEALAASLAELAEKTPGLVPAAKPEAKPGEDKARQKRREAVSAALGEALKGGEVKTPPAKERSRFLKYLEYDGPVFENLRPPPVLPGDLLAQMQGRPFTVQGQDGEVGVLSTTIEHPEAGVSARLRLLARNSPEGWKVRELANAPELIGLYQKNLENYNNQRESVFHAFNSRIREVMNAHCYLLLCEVVVDKILPDGTVKLIVHLEGTNIGKNTLLTAGIRAKLFDSEGQELAILPLGVNNRIPVGTSFRQYYNLELNWPPEVIARIKPLQTLRASWEITSLSLDNRLFLFPKPLSELTGKPS